MLSHWIQHVCLYCYPPANHAAHIPIICSLLRHQLRAATGLATAASGTTPPHTTGKILAHFSVTSTSSLCFSVPCPPPLDFPPFHVQFARACPACPARHGLDFPVSSGDARRPSVHLRSSSPSVPGPGAADPDCSGYQPAQLQHHLDAPVWRTRG